MAKKTIETGTSLKQGLKAVRQLGRGLRREAAADFSVQLSASTAGQLGLLRALNRRGRTLTAQNLRVTRGTAALTKKSAAVQRGIVRAERRITGELGGALGGYAGTVLRPAAVQTREATRKSRALQGVAQAGSRVAQMTQAVAAEGAAAQSAAAEYALAQALQQRNIVDSQTLAQMTGQMYQTALEYNQQWELWKRQQEFAKEQSPDSLTDAQVESFNATIPEIGEQAGRRWAFVNSPARGEDFEKPTVGQMIENWVTETGRLEGSPEHLIFANTLWNLQNGQDPGTATQNAFRTVYGGLEGFEKWGEELAKGLPGGVEVVALPKDIEEINKATGVDFSAFGGVAGVVGGGVAGAVGAGALGASLAGVTGLAGGAAAGGAGGILGGAAAGAAGGSVLPIVGTIGGAIVGGLVGLFAGGQLNEQNEINSVLQQLQEATAAGDRPKVLALKKKLDELT